MRASRPRSRGSAIAWEHVNAPNLRPGDPNPLIHRDLHARHSWRTRSDGVVRRDRVSHSRGQVGRCRGRLPEVSSTDRPLRPLRVSQRRLSLGRTPLPRTMRGGSRGTFHRAGMGRNSLSDKRFRLARSRYSGNPTRSETKTTNNQFNFLSKSSEPRRNTIPCLPSGHDARPSCHVEDSR